MVSGIAEAPPAGLGKLLMESRFAVPNHQRDYSWTEQVKQLFDDIDSAIEAADPTYFLGLMVFMGSESGELIVLDGQQRLTSIYALFEGKAPAFYEGESLYFDLYFDLAQEEFQFFQKLK